MGAVDCRSHFRQRDVSAAGYLISGGKKELRARTNGLGKEMMQLRGDHLAPAAAHYLRRNFCPGRFMKAGLALALLLPGCVRFHPKPLSVESSAAILSARSLHDPALHDLLRAHNKETRSSWGFDQVLIAALYFNPELNESRSRLAVAAAEKVTAGERPNPTLTFTPEYVTRTNIFPWVLTGSIDVPIETGGKPHFRLAQAENLSEAARLNFVTTAWRVRSRVRKSFLDLYAGREIARELHIQQDIQNEGVRILDAQLKAGAASPFQLAQARTALNQAQLAIGGAERQAAEAQVNLAEAIGVPTGSLGEVQLAFPDFERLPAAPDAASARRHALLHRADILGALSEYAASQSALQLAIAKQYPDIHLGPGYQLDQDLNKWALGLSLELPIFNQKRGAIAEADARREQAAAHFLTVQATALAEVDRALAGYRIARSTLAAANSQIGELRQQEESSRKMLEAGEISQADLAAIRLQSSFAELARLDALVRAQQVLGDLQDALQGGFGFSDLTLQPRVPAELKDHAR
jgi:outer membrane protein, heavy metal efflux system